MTPRERTYNTYHYLPVDHVPDIEFGYWNETFTVWHQQGLPEEISDNAIADRYFGFQPGQGVPADTSLLPPFETKVLEDYGDRQIIIDSNGVKCLIRTDGDSIPRCLDWSLKTPDDWERFKQRMDPHDPARYPDNWDELEEKINQSDLPVGIGCGSLFGRLRDWMGFENILIACMDQPEWIEQMMEDLTNFYLGVLERAVRKVHIDTGFFWEDMCFKQGPMISPQLFREWMTPRYQRLTDFVRQAGADVFIVDSDGNMNQLAGPWLEGGVNCMFPVEIAAGTDPEALRKEFGRDLLFQGGVNKRELGKGKAAIRREVDRVATLVEQGGFIPHVDHRCPPDVPYEDYLYYLKTKRETLGIPDPWADGPPDPSTLVEK